MPRQTHFDRVRALVSRHSGVPEAEITLESRLVEDLGIDGDDGHEFLEAFAHEFGVDLSRMHVFNYFEDEPPFSGASSLIPVVAMFSKRFREYLRHVARGRRTITVRNLVASARAGHWIRPAVAREDADLTRLGWWSRLVLAGSIGFPAGLGLWSIYQGAPVAYAVGGVSFVVALIWALLIIQFLASLSWLRALDAAATFEEGAQALSAAR